MKTTLTFKNFEPSEHLKKYATHLFEKLRRFLPKHLSAEVTVVLSVDKLLHQADAKLKGSGVSISALEHTHDMYTSLDLVYEKIKVQLKKLLEQEKSKRKSHLSDKQIDIFNYKTEGVGKKRVIIGQEKFEANPMHVDEATLQLEDSGDDFLVFLNSETSAINILYQNKKGIFSLIDIDG